MPQITGPNPSRVNATARYKVINHSGVSFAWTVQNGTILSGQGTDEIDVLWNTEGPANIDVLITKGDNTTELSVIVIDIMGDE